MAEADRERELLRAAGEGGPRFSCREEVFAASACGSGAGGAEYVSSFESYRAVFDSFEAYRARVVAATSEHLERGLRAKAFRVDMVGQSSPRVIVDGAEATQADARLLAILGGPLRLVRGSGDGEASFGAAITLDEAPPELLSLVSAALAPVRAAVLAQCARMAGEGRCSVNFGRNDTSGPPLFLNVTLFPDDLRDVPEAFRNLATVSAAFVAADSDTRVSESIRGNGGIAIMLRNPPRRAPPSGPLW